MKIQEELAEFSTAARPLGYSPFPGSLMLGSGNPPPTLSSGGEWAAEGSRILKRMKWLQGAGHMRSKDNN